MFCSVIVIFVSFKSDLRWSISLDQSLRYPKVHNECSFQIVCDVILTENNLAIWCQVLWTKQNMDIYFPPFFEAPPSEQINDVEVWHML